jgi:hypothetical protein
MEKNERLLALCRAETRCQADDVASPDYCEWLEEKRPFTEMDLINRWMVKIGDQCGGFLVRFEPEGRLSECDIFNPETFWPGSWAIQEDGTLRITVLSGNETTGPVICTLDVIASSEGTLHSGAENTTLSPDNIEFFKLMDLGEKVILPKYGEGTKLPT